MRCLSYILLLKQKKVLNIILVNMVTTIAQEDIFPGIDEQTADKFNLGLGW